jgi:ABC-type multidrug transport system ATPase subunit
MAESVIRSLSSVAAGGAGVLASLHSPTSAMATFFTHAIVLTADGRLAYQGPYSHVEAYLLTHLRRQVPPSFSTIELVLSLVARHSSGEGEAEHESAQALGKRMGGLVEAFAASGLAVKDPLPIENAYVLGIITGTAVA